MGYHRQDLTANELLILSSEMPRHEKSLAIAYLMLLGGHWGVHRFYLKKKKSAFSQLSLFIAIIVFYLATAPAIGLGGEAAFIVDLVLLIACLAGLGIWIIVDLFRIPHMVREWNARAEQEVIKQIVQYRSSSQAPSGF